MYKFHDVEQNTEEWLALRIAKLTSSKLGVVMARYGQGFGDPAKKYAVDIAVETLTNDFASNDSFSNAHTDRGHEQEPLARMAYEREMFCKITNGGFFDLDDRGCSPDGLVGDDGLIEIKSVIPSVHYANVKRGGIDPAYQWQIYGNLMYTERKWIDFISYCDTYPAGNKLYVYRVKASDCQEKFEMITTRTKQFLELVDESVERICNSSYLIV